MNQERLFQVLQSPHISEKGTILADRDRQYIFKVSRSATKEDVKNAVEQFFNVKVDAVRLLNVHGKLRSFRQKIGRKKSWKKAYVSLQEGSDIQFTNV